MFVHLKIFSFLVCLLCATIRILEVQASHMNGNPFLCVLTSNKYEILLNLDLFFSCCHSTGEFGIIRTKKKGFTVFRIVS